MKAALDLGLLLRSQRDHRRTESLKVDTAADEDLNPYALALAEQAEEQMLGPDVVVAKLQRLAQRELEYLLRSRSEWNVPARNFPLLAQADDLLDFEPSRVESDPQLLEPVCSSTTRLGQQAKQQVLSADVVVS